MAPNLNSEDYYEILGVPRSADEAALKKAYKKLAVKWHPDKNPGDERATKNFQKISEAYATLSDDKKRKIYDMYGKDAANQSDQMPDDVPMGGHGGFGGFPGGGMPGGGFSFRPGGGGGGHGMSQEEAAFLFSQFFGGSDPFGAFGGMGGGGPGVRINMGGPRGSRRGGGGMQDPFGGAFGGSMGGGMPGGFGSMPGGFGGSYSEPSYSRVKRYDAIPSGTVVSLKGLVNRPDRNGDRGQVVQYDARSGRYIIQLEDTDETMSVKPANLLQHVHVKLHGLESRPELNGQRGTIIAWDPAKLRYNVYIMSTGKALSLRPSNVVLEDGTVGQIVNLQSKPELNGQWGTIKSFNSQSGRYDIQLSADKILRLKLENIHV
jgi:curved DNA-binding protein CbpA